MLTKHLAMFARARLTIVWALRAKPQHKPSRTEPCLHLPALKKDNKIDECFA